MSPPLSITHIVRETSYDGVGQDTTLLHLTANDPVAEMGPIDSSGLAFGLLLDTTLALSIDWTVTNRLDFRFSAR